MTDPGHGVPLEEQIDRWRSSLRRRQAIHSTDVAELEDHLREQVAVLAGAGLATDEAFLVAVKRMGNLDALSREFAREHSDRLWKQLVVVTSDSGEPRARAVGPGGRPHGLHSILGRALHLLRPDRPRRRRPHGVHGDDLPGYRNRRRALLRVVAATV